jgi:hypothetical protein
MSSGESIKSYGSSIRCVGDAGASGIDEIKTVHFTIYPNPVNNELNISSSNAIDRVEIYNLAGSLMEVSSNNKINTSMLAQGTYFVKVYSAKKIGIEEFVK